MQYKYCNDTLLLYIIDSIACSCKSVGKGPTHCTGSLHIVLCITNNNDRIASLSSISEKALTARNHNNKLCSI